MISTISTTKAYDRSPALPASTGSWEMWWCLACNADYRGDRQAKRLALAQYRRAVELEIGSQLIFED